MTIALIPLDERPANTRYPRMIADIAGVDLAMPPPEVLSKQRQPADHKGLATWLHNLVQGGELTDLIVSVEMLGYGGLMASRITDDRATDVLKRLDILPQLLTIQPTLRITAFNVITRISNADHNVEEPLYWGTYGRAIYEYSQLRHRADEGQDVADELAALEARIPRDNIADFTHRRLRNHIVNLAMLEMADDGLLDLLVLSSDDTSPYGYGSQEKAWLNRWRERLDTPDERLLMYPGADEVGSVLLMRAIYRERDPLQCYVHYAVEEDAELVAPYEDSPLRVTVERQITALGATITEDIDAADLVVAVNTPSRILQEFDHNNPDHKADQEARLNDVIVFRDFITESTRAGRAVVICDVAYPNGSDPALILGFSDHIDWRRLAAYGGWNTAGNTIGVALAQGAASLFIDTDDQEVAQRKFLIHRLMEDYAYQQVVRGLVREWIVRDTDHTEVTADNQTRWAQSIENLMIRHIDTFDPLVEGWTVANVRFPWGRTFEIDFDLERER